jgi:sugar lactone lactonase YvrE
MKPESKIHGFGVIAVLVALVAVAAIHSIYVQAADTKYRVVENWAQLPNGGAWGTMSGVDIDPRNGTIYVFQRSEPASIMAFDSKGKFLRSWGDTKMFPSAHALRVDREGNVWITDRGVHQVMKFSPQGKLLLELGKKGVKGDNDSKDALNGPSDVVIGKNGDIFVSDGESTNTRVVKFSKNGKLIKFWGVKGSGPGQLDVPHSIAMDSKGLLYVADRANKRIQVFDQDGKYISQTADAGTPYGIFITKEDMMYVVDGTDAQDMVVINLKDGKVVEKMTGLKGPHMISVDSKGAIYIAETTGKAVRKFERDTTSRTN